MSRPVFRSTVYNITRPRVVTPSKRVSEHAGAKPGQQKPQTTLRLATAPSATHHNDSLSRVARVAMLAALVVWACLFLISFRTAGTSAFILGTFGLIAAWRYGWVGLHFVRAALFLKLVFPRLAKRSRNPESQLKVSKIYAIVASYDIVPVQFRTVYRSLICNALAYDVPITIIAAITSDSDRVMLVDLLEEFNFPEGVEIVAQFQQGTGKRDAIASALRSIARRSPPRGSVTLMLDGDVVLQPDTLDKCLPFFSNDLELAALTVNNDAILERDGITRQWYALRHAQRHVLMASMALSDRLLVLTGRFSVYRTKDVVDPAFIDIIANDSTVHWLHGKFKFLSGDDKSAWFHILRQQGKMLYVPDVKVVSFESLPCGRGFVSGSTRLMMRWYGNMLRSNGRALRLGPRVCRPFVWWCLLDQRVSMWTSLLGLTTAVLLAVTYSPVYLALYACWVVLTRLITSGLCGLFWGRFDPRWPFILAYLQIWGALIKISLLFNQRQQSWDRQTISNSGGMSTVSQLANLALLAASVTVFLYLVATAYGITSPAPFIDLRLPTINVAEPA